MSQTISDAFQKNKIMSNEPNKAANAPANNAADQPVKTDSDKKPDATITPAAPAAAPVETKKS
jgi:hypothetical protein